MKKKNMKSKTNFLVKNIFLITTIIIGLCCIPILFVKGNVMPIKEPIDVFWDVFTSQGALIAFVVIGTLLTIPSIVIGSIQLQRKKFKKGFALMFVFLLTASFTGTSCYFLATIPEPYKYNPPFIPDYPLPIGFKVTDRYNITQPVIENITVELHNSVGQYIESGKTNSSGYYLSNHKFMYGEEVWIILGEINTNYLPMMFRVVLFYGWSGGSPFVDNLILIDDIFYLRSLSYTRCVTNDYPYQSSKVLDFCYSDFGDSLNLTYNSTDPNNLEFFYRYGLWEENKTGISLRKITYFVESMAMETKRPRLFIELTTNTSLSLFSFNQYNYKFLMEATDKNKTIGLFEVDEIEHDYDFNGNMIGGTIYEFFGIKVNVFCAVDTCLNIRACIAIPENDALIVSSLSFDSIKDNSFFYYNLMSFSVIYDHV